MRASRWTRWMDIDRGEGGGDDDDSDGDDDAMPEDTLEERVRKKTVASMRENNTNARKG